ncbi:uncharacterized protein LOC132060516 [Lycium ferocissimum]|uniref:uncharacterized protein LOC132060516 n=1 Tax=Lycium ferocissimum TaxID=112874 RepID=UPI002814AB01|nr:uncharacterized protein LOC132060516 [Lycium ferocissimum]XP_059309516.1 uncharacterized protein LOC132060516 [Lycium ferocissimum]XP_059309517.1 uncharacterized protein LOC132060516 [Lycium ferocissimum]
MATEELTETKEWHVVKNWRNAQKEKERERRRIRDRLRRQTMSNEEREKHLARRRRNYQLRRQKVLNNSFSSSQNYDSTTSAGYSNEEENQANVPVSGLEVQLSDATFHPEFGSSQEEPADASSALQQGVEERRYKVQRNPNILPLYQIRHLARLLNSLSSDNQGIGTSLMSKDNITTESRSRRGIRLIDVKRLARALNAN